MKRETEERQGVGPVLMAGPVMWRGPALTADGLIALFALAYLAKAALLAWRFWSLTAPEWLGRIDFGQLRAAMPFFLLGFSGLLQSRADLEKLAAAGYRAFLIGERFMTDPDRGRALRELTQVRLKPDPTYAEDCRSPPRSLSSLSHCCT